MQPSALCSTFRLEDSNEPNTQTKKSEVNHQPLVVDLTFLVKIQLNRWRPIPRRLHPEVMGQMRPDQFIGGRNQDAVT